MFADIFEKFLIQLLEEGEVVGSNGTRIGTAIQWGTGGTAPLYRLFVRQREVLLLVLDHQADRPLYPRLNPHSTSYPIPFALRKRKESAVLFPERTINRGGKGNIRPDGTVHVVVVDGRSE